MNDGTRHRTSLSRRVGKKLRSSEMFTAIAAFTDDHPIRRHVY